MIKEARTKIVSTKWLIIAILFLLAISLLTYGVYNRSQVSQGEWMQIMILLALVVITGFYALSADRQARASSDMVKEMERTRSAAFRPIIALYVPLYDDSMSPVSFRFKNVGTGPALNVKLSLRHPVYKFNEHYESAWAAGQEEHRDFYSVTPLEPLFQPTGAFVPEAVYEDVYGQVFQSTLESLPNDKHQLVVKELGRRAKK